MLWEVKRLPAPGTEKTVLPQALQGPALSVWLAGEQEYCLNPEAVLCDAASREILFYPLAEGSAYLRNAWYMVRRKRPIVPAPSNAPMPDKYRSGDKRAIIYATYLRPWVLERAWATPGQVPHICDLGIIPDSLALPRPRLKVVGKQAPLLPSRGYERAWEWYIRGHVVSRHAVRIIIQFMTACCGKSRREEVVEESVPRVPREARASDMALASLHSILDEVGKQPQGDCKPQHEQGSAADGDEETRMTRAVPPELMDGGVWEDFCQTNKKSKFWFGSNFEERGSKTYQKDFLPYFSKSGQRPIEEPTR